MPAWLARRLKCQFNGTECSTRNDTGVNGGYLGRLLSGTDCGLDRRLTAGIHIWQYCRWQRELNSRFVRIGWAATAGLTGWPRRD